MCPTFEKQKPTLKTIQELHPVLMDMKQCVVLDIETTGFSPDKHAEIIEIGAVKLDLVKRQYSKPVKQYIRPSDAFTIPQKITELTGISWADVSDQPFIEEVLPRFAKFIGDLPIVAHNAAFDWPRFLVPAFEMVGLHATNECICSMRLAKEVFPGRGKNGYSLESLCDFYGYSMPNHHDALNDTITTGSLFVKLLDEYRRIHANEGDSLFDNRSSALNPLPSSIPNVSFENLSVKRVSPNKGISKRHGPRIYVATNYGRLCYSVRRRLWTCIDLWTELNAPAQLWGECVLYKMGVSIDDFIRTYQAAA